MLKAAVDTNVLPSGLVYRRGNPYELLQRGLAGDINLTVSQSVANLHRHEPATRGSAEARNPARPLQARPYPDIDLTPPRVRLINVRDVVL